MFKIKKTAEKIGSQYQFKFLTKTLTKEWF